jgi:glyoxylase-like metal-dependent hydrolase (beta-lactamase superfamily II)
MSIQGNGRSLIQSRLPEQARALPKMITDAIQQRASTSTAAPGVERINMLLANAYLVGEPGAGDRQWVLVDAGVLPGRPAIAAAAKTRFGPDSRPAAIVLTHGHFDHVGGLPQLADYWDAPLYCHRLELPYVTGRSSYPPPDPSAGGGMMSLMSRFFPRGPYDFGQRVRELPADGSVPGTPGWRWIHTPGHTPGHVALFRDSDRTLIAGDAFVTTQQESMLAVLTQKAKVTRPPGYYTPDWPAAKRSVEHLLTLQPETAATGHGPPMSGERLRQGLRELLDGWEQHVVPTGGRYSQKSAIADDLGVKSYPPPSRAANVQLIAGLGLLALVGAAILNRRKDS